MNFLNDQKNSVLILLSALLVIALLGFGGAKVDSKIASLIEIQDREANTLLKWLETYNSLKYVEKDFKQKYPSILPENKSELTLFRELNLNRYGINIDYDKLEILRIESDSNLKDVGLFNVCLSNDKDVFRVEKEVGEITDLLSIISSLEIDPSAEFSAFKIWSQDKNVVLTLQNLCLKVRHV